MAKNQITTIANLEIGNAVKAAGRLNKVIGTYVAQVNNASINTNAMTDGLADQLGVVQQLWDQIDRLGTKYADTMDVVKQMSPSVRGLSKSVKAIEGAQRDLGKRKDAGFYSGDIEEKKGWGLVEGWGLQERDLVAWMRANGYQKVDTSQPSELRTAKGRRIPSQEKAGELSEDFWDSSGEGRLAPTEQNFDDAHNRKQDEKERDAARKAAAARQKTDNILETQKRERIRRRVNEVHRNNEAERKSEEGRQRTESILGIQRKERTGRIVAHEKTKDTVRQIREELEARKSANNQVTKTIDLIGELTAARASESATIEGNASALKKLEDQEKALLDWDAKAVGLTKQKTAQLNKIRTEKNKYTKSTADLVKEQEKENLTKDKGVKILSKFEKALEKSDKSSGVRRATGKTNIKQLKEMRSSLIKLIGTEKLSNAAKEKAEALTKRLNTQIRQETVAIERLAKAKQKATLSAGGYSKSMGRLNAIISNGSFAIQDFVTVLQGGGGLERAVLSTTNNIGMMTSLALPGLKGALLGVGVAVGTFIVPQFLKMIGLMGDSSDAMDDAKNSAESYADRMQAIREKQFGMVDAVHAHIKSLNDETDATDTVAVAQKELVDKIADVNKAWVNQGDTINREYGNLLAKEREIVELEQEIIDTKNAEGPEDDKFIERLDVRTVRLELLSQRIKDNTQFLADNSTELENARTAHTRLGQSQTSLNAALNNTSGISIPQSVEALKNLQDALRETSGDEREMAMVAVEASRKQMENFLNVASARKKFTKEQKKDLQERIDLSIEAQTAAVDKKISDDAKKELEKYTKAQKAIADGQKKATDDMRSFNKRTSKLLDDQVTQQRKAAEEEKRILEERARQLGIQSDAYIHAMEVAKFKIEQAKKKEEEGDDPFRVQTADEEIAALNARRLSLGMGPVKDRRIIRRAQGRELRQTRLAQRDARSRARKSKVRIDDLTEMFQGAEGGLGALGPNDGFTMGVPNQMIGERARIDAYKELLEADRKLIASGKKRKGEPELEKVMSLQEMLAINQEGAAAISTRLVERQNKLAENLRETHRANQQIQRSQRPRIQSNQQQ